jgi:hypothetical protein
MLNAKRYAPMNARDKMPFEVTPVFYKLQRYDVAAAEPPAPAAAPGAAPPAPGDQPAAAPDATPPPPAQPTGGAPPAPPQGQEPAAAAQNPQ